jgi:hypothetical protein
MNNNLARHITQDSLPDIVRLYPHYSVHRDYKYYSRNEVLTEDEKHNFRLEIARYNILNNPLGLVRTGQTNGFFRKEFGDYEADRLLRDIEKQYGT